MYERFTIDVILQEMTTDLAAGQPSRRLVARLSRRGHWDGKRMIDPSNVASLVTEAVNLAAASLSVEFFARRAELEEQRAEMEARCSALRIQVTESRRPSEDPGLPPVEVEPESIIECREIEAVAVPLHDFDGDRELGAALLRRRRLAHQQAVATQNEGRARRSEGLRHQAQGLHEERAAREAQSLARMSDVEDLERRIAICVAAREGLRKEFLLRFESMARVGGLLWSCYCNGFERGYAVRRSHGTGVQPPRQGLHFYAPAALADTALIPDQPFPILQEA